MKTRDRLGMPAIMLALSAFVLIYWFIAKTTDIYYFIVIGALFELLWLPMLLLLFLLPVIIIILWKKEHFHSRSLYLYALLINVLSILIMIILTK